MKIGILSTAHLHATSYVACLKQMDSVELVGIWDDQAERGRAFAERASSHFFDQADELLRRSDAVLICGENTKHRSLIERAARGGKHIFCEKPLVTRVEDGQAVIEAARAAGICLMPAFPCAFSPAFQKLCARVKAGDIGRVLAISATNRGRCPFDWFVQKELSGGGALIDHTVHVADLLYRLLGEEPLSVHAQVGNGMYAQDWEDVAMLSLSYPSGVFATLDSSWSRLASYKTWGDVTMNVVGEKGVIELNLFAQNMDSYKAESPNHRLESYGSHLDLLMLQEFVSAIRESREPSVTAQDGLRASKVAIAGYESAQAEAPASLAS